MRKLFALLTLTIPVLIFSQEPNNKDEKKDKKGIYRWDIGINGGVNINNPIVDDSPISGESFQGNLYGLTLIYHFNRILALKADFDIENRGWQMDEFQLPDTSTSLEDVTQVLNYFDIPAFMHIGFGNKFKIDLNVGPYVGFKVKDEIVSYEPDGTQLNDSDTRGRIGISKFDNIDFGVVYGIGFDYQFHERISIGFDALFERGMRVINEGGYKNSSIDFDFGINFRLGKKKKKNKND